MSKIINKLLSISNYRAWAIQRDVDEGNWEFVSERDRKLEKIRLYNYIEEVLLDV